MRVLILLLVAVPTFAQDPPGGKCQAPVRPEHVVSNWSGVACAWVSLAALANRTGDTALAATASRQPGPLRDPNSIPATCKAHGVACEMIRDAGKLPEFLTRHVTNGKRPCAIGVYSGRHVVLVTHYEHGVRVGTVGNQPGGGEPRMWLWADYLATLQPDGLAYCLTGK